MSMSYDFVKRGEIIFLSDINARFDPKPEFNQTVMTIAVQSNRQNYLFAQPHRCPKNFILGSIDSDITYVFAAKLPRYLSFDG